MTITDRSRMLRSHRIVGAGVAAVLSVALVAGCAGRHSSTSGTAPKSASPAKVRVMLDWTPNTNHAGMYLAKSAGYYRAAGLEVTFIQPGQNSDPNQAVGSGTVDFGISASEQLIPARAHGVPVVSVAAIIQHNTSSLITLASSAIDRPRDLAGHTYGSYGGGDFEKALVDQLVSCDGGDPSKVRFTQVGDSDYREGLTKRQFDAVWVFDGWDVIRLRDIDHLAIDRMPFSEYQHCIPDWYTPILVTSEKLIAKNPALVKAFMAATARGYRQAMAHPDQAAASLIAQAPGLDSNLVRRSMHYLSTRYAADPAAWGEQDPKVWNRFVDFLEAHHIVAAGFDTKAAYTNRFLTTGG
ncbi:MAG: ABC transporter substrate-binding protein [Actinobacteria bacterium]|nr:ABC transporter substrate-binding protein [Actinomycetota bacterium]